MTPNDRMDALLSRPERGPLEEALRHVRLELATNAVVLARMYEEDPANILDPVDLSLSVTQIGDRWTIVRTTERGLSDILMQKVDDNGVTSFRPRSFKALCSYLWLVLESRAQECSRKYKHRMELLMNWASTGTRPPPRVAKTPRKKW